MSLERARQPSRYARVMRVEHALASAIVMVLGCGGPGGALDGGQPDGGSVRDAGARDAGAHDAAVVDGGADASTPDDGGPCTRHDFGASIQLSRGLVVARDGAIYFSQLGGVGRVAPDGTIDATWITIEGATLIGGLALDPANEALFVAVPDLDDAGAPSIYRVDVAARTSAPLVSGGFPYGLAVGPDGLLYYGDNAAGHVFRVSPSGGTSEQVTTSPIPSARGVAFEAGGTLLATSASPGQIFRLTLSAAGLETARESVTTFPTPTFLAIDALDRIYVTSEGGGALVRMNADGSEQVLLRSDLSSPFALDFASGALCATDLYLVAGNGQIVRYENDTPGADVSWH